jgi:DNA-binding NtrC family response regulator
MEDAAMVRVLVVDHDLDLADQKVDTLRRAGFEVDQCGGPTHALTACPVLRGMPCWQVEWADVLVYDVWASGWGGEELTQDLLDQYPGKAIVLTSQGMDVGWTQGGVGATVSGHQEPGALVKAVEAAYAALDRPTSSDAEGLAQQ